MACTAITMVKLLESRQNVMTVEKMMLGEKWNGLGQSGVESRSVSVGHQQRGERERVGNDEQPHPELLRIHGVWRTPACPDRGPATAELASDIDTLPPNEK